MTGLFPVFSMVPLRGECDYDILQIKKEFCKTHGCRPWMLQCSVLIFLSDDRMFSGYDQGRRLIYIKAGRRWSCITVLKPRRGGISSIESVFRPYGAMIRWKIPAQGVALFYSIVPLRGLSRILWYRQVWQGFTQFLVWCPWRGDYD